VKVTGTPLGVDGVDGLILRPTITAGVTSRVVVEVIPLYEAVIVVLPTATAEATPVALLIVTILIFPDDQVTWLVMIAVDPSEYFPVAVKLVENPLGVETTAGVIATLDKLIVGV
jgi:hypothetical protein